MANGRKVGTGRRIARLCVLAAFAGVAGASGCGSVRPGAGDLASAPAGDLAGEPVDAPPARPREADLPPRDRWDTPFAVSASGQVTPLQPRQILVVGSDPNIAAGLAEQRAVELGPPRGGSAEPAPTGAASGAPPSTGQDTEPAAVGASASSTRPPPSPAEEINTRTHLVQAGETWSSIAARYGVSPADMYNANPGVDPQRVRVGQQLMIPSTPGSSGPVVHRVVSGDTLSEIADRYNVTPAMIQRANGLIGDRIQVGQELTIPVPGN